MLIMIATNFRLLAFSFILFLISNSSLSQKALGIFDNSTDLGKVLHKGSVEYNPSTQRYVITGSGTNIWNTHDEFQYVWKKVKGNFILQTRAAFIGKGVEAHRKIGWMVRTSLDTSSPTLIATIHGDGLTSLQYRKLQGGTMSQDTFTQRAPDVIELERKGNQFIMSVAHFGEPYTQLKAENIDLGDEVYVGLFVCSHNKDVVEKAWFDNVRINKPIKENFAPYREYIGYLYRYSFVAST
jgi:TolB protein